MAKFLTLHALTYHEISFFFGKKIVDTTNVDRSSPTFTFFEWSGVQKDTLFKALNIEFQLYTVVKTQDPANYTLLGSQKHITLNTVFGPMRSAPNSSGHARVFCPTCIHSMWGKSLIWVKAKMQSNNNKKYWRKLVIRYYFCFLFQEYYRLSAHPAIVAARRAQNWPQYWNCVTNSSPFLFFSNWVRYR